MSNYPMQFNSEQSRQALAALTRGELFAPLPAAALNELAAATTIRTVRRAEHLWEHGATSSFLAVVVEGRAKCWSPGHDRRQWISSVVVPGGICGLAACVEDGPYTCTAEALERSRIALVSSAALRTAMEREPAFARRVAVALAKDVRRFLSTCEDVALRTPLERLAHFLQAHADGGDVVALHETQAQIAAQLGTVREVVGRGLRRLESRSIVARTGHTVRILKPQQLAQISAGMNGA